MDALFKLKRNKGAAKKKISIGRGNGSGRGSYSGRGGKGQTANTGGNIKPGFIGGQTPIYLKMPKSKGFKNINHVEFQVVNLNDLNIFEENATVDKDKLYAKNLIRSASNPVKILGTGELTKKLNFEVDRVSESARVKIEKSKGSIKELMAKKDKSEVQEKKAK